MFSLTTRDSFGPLNYTFRFWETIIRPCAMRIRYMKCGAELDIEFIILYYKIDCSKSSFVLLYLEMILLKTYSKIIRF